VAIFFTTRARWPSSPIFSSGQHIAMVDRAYPPSAVTDMKPTSQVLVCSELQPADPRSRSDRPRLAVLV
ncbi:MAG: hypothetical protein ABIR67_10625, partial [Gaiellaceae bacterium]